MKKLYKLLAATATCSLLGSMTAFAGEWKSDQTGWWYVNDDGCYTASAWQEISGKWYYFRGDGYMAASTWIGNYYVGADGAMLTNTTTPDGYQVDESGAWIPENTDSRPMAPYCDILSNPLSYGGGYGIFYILGEQSALSDYGNYYSLGGQNLWFYKTYDTEKEAKQSKCYHETYGGPYLGDVKRLSNGKYIVCDARGYYETITVYTGPIYIDKNAIVDYYDFTDSSYNTQRYTCTLEEYWARSGSIPCTMPGTIQAYATQIDEKGYATYIKLQQWE